MLPNFASTRLMVWPLILGCVIGVCHGQTPITVSDATTLALAKRPSIRAALERVFAAQNKQSEMSVMPPLRLEFGYETHPDLGIGNDLFLAVPIDLFGKTRAQYLVAHADLLTAEAALQQAEMDLQTEVFTSYSELLSAEDLAASGKELVDLAQKSYDATKQRIATGDLPPNQELRADLELRKAKQTYQSRVHTLTSARRSFTAAVGLTDSEPIVVDATFLASPRVKPFEERADLAAARATIEAGRAEAHVARTTNTPDFELEFARDYWDNPGRFVARAQFVWNFFDYGASRGRRAGAAHTLEAASLFYSDLVIQARTQAETARLDFESAQEEATNFRALIGDAQDLLSKEQKAFALGASSLLDVIDATRSLRDTEESSIEARSRAIVAEAKYLAATGTLLGTLPNRKFK